MRNGGKVSGGFRWPIMWKGLVDMKSGVCVAVGRRYDVKRRKLHEIKSVAETAYIFLTHLN